MIITAERIKALDDLSFEWVKAGDSAERTSK